MEKLIYRLEGNELPKPAAIAQIVREHGGCDIRINLRDADVAAGDMLIQRREGNLADCVIQFWLPSSNSRFRERIDEAFQKLADTVTGWLVCESTIIENQDRPADGVRNHGFAQIACLTLPKGTEWHEWRRIWRDGHTQVAIDTQSNFEYRQNLVVECLTTNDVSCCDDIVAIVEECFPIGALEDPLLFFDAAGDMKKFKQNLDTMMASCERFIQPGTIEVFPTSQYNFGSEEGANA